MSKFSMLSRSYSDLYKDVFGVRPRGIAQSYSALKADFRHVSSMLPAVIAEEAAEDAARIAGAPFREMMRQETSAWDRFQAG